MALTVDHIQTIVAAVDAGWSPAELIADMNSGLDHFGLASINALALPAPVPVDTFQLPALIEEKVAVVVPTCGFYNAMGMFEPDYDDEAPAVMVI
ncbi:hypothetical protein [Rhizobium sp. MHM7A]|uniref:hypothetical protein n=1 Tax=Rhizobium sp. MHM7A TaxID=2583233 RepID=UPI001105BFBB|nr:hypothetical protein [Rhizobium sp. MHM7A]TLX16475.1 hypothetical protein FFR93_03825 [Rhizobium sp. MHM7A]